MVLVEFVDSSGEDIAMNVKDVEAKQMLFYYRTFMIDSVTAVIYSNKARVNITNEDKENKLIIISN